MVPSQADIAAALQIDAALVTRYKKRGMPVDSVEAARAWKDANVRARVGSAPPDDDAAKSEDGGGDDYWRSRSRREAAEASIAELKRDELTGDLIRVSAVRAAMINAYATLREAILNLPARLAPQLAAESDTAAIQTLLHAELHSALTTLAGASSKIDADQPTEPASE